MSTFKYCCILLVSFFCFMIAVGAVNYAVNPYLMFDSVTTVFDMKPEAASRVRTFKKYQGENKGYQTLIVGNSRVEMGLDPESDAFKSKPVYNVGVPGLSMQGQLAYAQNLIASNPIKEIYIAIDFADFLSKPTIQRYPPYELEKEIVADYMASVFSLDALVSAFYTVINQSKLASTRTYQGFNPANDYIPILKNEGQHVLTSQKLELLSTMFSSQIYNQELMRADTLSPLNILIREITKLHDAGIKISVFINPYQDLYYEKMKENQIFDDFNVWKKDVSLALEDKVHFYDFTELGMTSSNLKNANGDLTYFWEPAHYKRELGDIMLERMAVVVK